MNRGIPRKPSASFPTASLNRNNNHHPSVKTEAPTQQSTTHDLIKSLTKGVVGFAAAATALASVCSDSPAFAESLTVAFLFPALKSQLMPHTVIRGMLSTLGDPFTRIISPKEYQSFRIGSDGNLQGVGLFISVEPKTGHLHNFFPESFQFLLALTNDFYLLLKLDSHMLFCHGRGSPAARAGIHDGDELIEINGKRLDGVDSESAAQRLRGQAGTSVTVKLHRNGSGSGSSIKEVKLPRELIRLSPISSTVIPHRTPDGRLTKTGYLKLATFSQTAATDMKNTIHEMENQGVQSYILDLRNNPGGLVKVGLDVAQIWLDGNETLVNTIDRDGHMSPINMANSHALTHDPLVVLVNEGSASASEILAGALHDNGRAILVGHKTFGKGKIQSITELHDGSALFVTVAKYLSPALHDIDQVGIAPDVQCTTDILNPPKETLKEKSPASSLEADSCIMVAEHELDIQKPKGTAS
ncbi:Carboxyl-terminal-processing peptidase 3 [Hibiscus syriacus]|uniref:C-terminal processing peptidase n=1 Tax=Hibiscus syriacus TaxID=106335 RepID=A0A6A3CXU0_HIBSY|nr:Carboxyl-terminal-processing peptidase 3 [Hibiscus syriacus]